VPNECLTLNESSGIVRYKLIKREKNMQVAVIHTAFEQNPNTVALVEVDDAMSVEEQLEYAYRWTNNVMGSWSIQSEFLSSGKNGDYNENVTVIAPLPVDDRGQEWGLRSTSMGDQMLVGNTKYEVAMCGFEKISA
jgi:hypothetical protein